MEIYNLFDMSTPPRLVEFINYMLTVKNMSFGTVKNYKSDILLLLRFVKKYKTRSKENVNDIDISDVDDIFLNSIALPDLYMYMSYLTLEKKLKPNSRARKIASARAFFNYLQLKAKVITNNPTRELETPKLDKRNPVYLTLEQSQKLLDSIDGRNKERDYCIITIFLNCGVRLSELVGMNINNIQNDTLTVVGKGNKERTVYLNDSCLDAINKYLEVRVEPKDAESRNALFLSERGVRISDRVIQVLVKKFFEKANLVDKKYTPHKLRHTAATLLYKYGKVDIRAIQQILGHENIATTQIYTHVDAEQLRDAVKSNPLGNYKKQS